MRARAAPPPPPRPKGDPEKKHRGQFNLVKILVPALVVLFILVPCVILFTRAPVPPTDGLRRVVPGANGVAVPGAAATTKPTLLRQKAAELAAVPAKADTGFAGTRAPSSHLLTQEQIESDVLGLVHQVTEGLAPYMTRFFKMTKRDKMVRAHPKEPPACAKWSEEHPNTFLGGCATDNCQQHRGTSLDEMKALCLKDSGCGGIIKSGSSMELRQSPIPDKSASGESSWSREPCDADIPDTNNKKIVKAFYDSVAKALKDPTLATFQRPPPPVKEDGSIFVSVASYRDDVCPASLRSMFRSAEHPEKLTVAIIQQNCEEECETGTGWANTRRLVPSDPDPHCAREFCESEFGKPHCEAGRVRVLRMQEYEAWGPFFARFLASKLWNGQNYILQIDAHTQFRENWDSAFIHMIKKTPSYPKSVLSTYPDSFGGGFSKRAAPLCGFTFEGHGTGKTIRLQQSFSAPGHGEFARAAFIAAGFFFTHGSAFREIPFDPYLPYIFMGEEIAMSSRFWTNGFDIYAPIESQLKHAYVRAESSKFWETVNRVFSDAGAHNSITDVVMSRIQHLMKFPHMADPKEVKPSWLLTHMAEFNQGTVRSLDDFFKYHNIDMQNSRQHPPKWCSPGGVEPGWVTDGLPHN